MKTAVDRVDFEDSGKKNYTDHIESITPGRVGDGQLALADPDAGLSEEERARIVRTGTYFQSNVCCRFNSRRVG